jgi:SAM-dependent methyltransferase
MRGTLAGTIRRALSWTRNHPCRPVRRAVAGGRAHWVRAIPSRLRIALELDGPVVRPLKVEVGSGPFPTPGYIHVDFDRDARHLEHRAPAWDLPFEDHSVSEVLAIHVLEHVHPGMLRPTLDEWRRVLAPGGRLRVHVPDADHLFAAFSRADPSGKWGPIVGLLGMSGPPDVTHHSQLDPARHAPDHKLMFDFTLLRAVLEEHGFADVIDRSGCEDDRHTRAWAPFVDGFSLIVHATAPSPV